MACDNCDRPGRFKHDLCPRCRGIANGTVPLSELEGRDA